MEESKELQGFYKIFRAVIYISVLMEFFEYAIDSSPMGSIVCDLHSRIKQWMIYQDGNMAYSKIATFLLVCITCVGTRNKKHLEFDARKQVLYPLVSGVVQYTDGNASVYFLAEHLIIYGSIHHRCSIGTYSLGQHQQVPEGRTVERPF